MATTISSILPWVRYFLAHHLAPNNPEILENTYQVRADLNEKISIWQGDITKLEVDAIVNAANCSLLGGGGVDGAIHRAAGEELFEECSKLNGCEIGEAKITKGYKLPAKHVIHTVGTMTKDAQELAKAYNSCFTLMLQNSLRSIAFPCISTGVYGYDPEQAAHVAVYQARKFLTENHEKVDRVIFCVFLDSDLKIYEEIMQRYFPVKEPPADYTPKDFEAYVKANPEAKKSYADALKKPNVREVTDWSQISSKV